MSEILKSDSEALLLDIDLFISAVSSVMFKRRRIWNGKCVMNVTSGISRKL